ncbi:MAG: tail fiber domain-containing protein, partial [Ginsengibacter sp.]
TSGNSSSYAGYFNGKVFSSGGYSSSDRKLKQDITEVTNAMEIILKLQPKHYKFRQDGNYKLMNLPAGKHYGLIAQDVENILPDLVSDTKFDTRMAQPDVKDKAAADSKPSEIIDFKALNYTELIPIMIKAMQELNKKNENLQNQVNELKSLIAKSGNGTTTTSTAYLKQNSPNPFNNSTVIGYYIPDNAGYAQIKITDIKGSVIKTFNPSKGEGQINIRSGELPAGTYNYTLYINNKTIDTNQMVLLK